MDEKNTEKSHNIDSPNYLKELNDEQLQAVLHTEGPLLILAGAGAGKTKTITYRILHLIKKGVDPRQILAITFTNKAANEMRERVFDLIKKENGELWSSTSTVLPVENINLSDSNMNGDFGFNMIDAGDTGIADTTNTPANTTSNTPSSYDNQNKPFVSTFHSLAVYILKEFGSHMNIHRHFAIYDRSDSKQAVKDAIVSSGHDPKQIEPGKILSIISKAKGDFTSQAEYEAQNGDDYVGNIVSEVWKKYDATLAREKALDFDDLLFKATLLLSVKEEVRKYYQNKWKYIHIDEYQDTNQVQYRLTQLLVGENKNIAVVGDGDQSVYSWRGANIRNILKFEEDYVDAKVILLEQNYRSTQTILTAANRVIEKNIYRKKKNLFTKNTEGDKITIYTAYDENDEANFVANTVRDLREKASRNSGDGVGKTPDIAVLFRANFQSRAIEEAFLRRNIPYTLLGTKFFDRKEVKDVLAYLRAALNRDSLTDIKRIINTPVRGIGKTTMLKVLEGRENDLPAGARLKVGEFYALLERIKHTAETSKTSEVVKYVIQASGIEQAYKNEKAEEQIENIKELVTLATKYDYMEAPTGIEKLIEEASLASDQDTLDQKVQNRVQGGGDRQGGNGELSEQEMRHAQEAAHQKASIKLMTVHASKGLEFDYVFITGLEEGLFPHSRSGDGAKSLEDSEEERRLFYVALTRARKKLYLSHANVRTIFGNKQVTLPSEFVSDIDDDLVEKEEPVSGIKSIFIDF